jgi:hypothetical protein
MVTIKDGLGARQGTAEAAFLLYLRKKALDGSEAAQERLEEIQAFRREHDPTLGPEGITTIVRVIVSPDNPNHALQLLKMAVKLYRFQPHAQIKLEPRLVQRALDRLGDQRLTAMQQATVVAATRTPTIGSKPRVEARGDQGNRDPRRAGVLCHARRRSVRSRLACDAEIHLAIRSGGPMDRRT